MIKRLFYTLLGVLLSQFSQAQTDTAMGSDSLEISVDKDFSTYSSALQFSIGKSLTVGDYGGREIPFSDGFAYEDATYQLSINAKYSRRIKNNYGFELGVEYLRNVFDWQGFNDAYLKTYGDTLGIGRFFYEHLSLFVGTNYNFSYKKLMASISAGVGMIYNFSIRGDGFVSLTTSPRNIDNYKGGDLEIVNGVQPLFYSGFNLKYDLGDEFYIVANSHFTYSLFKIKVTEKTSFREERDYLNRSIAINNISLSLGVGTLF